MKKLPVLPKSSSSQRVCVLQMVTPEPGCYGGRVWGPAAFSNPPIKFLLSVSGSDLHRWFSGEQMLCVPLFPVLFPGENESFQRSFSKVCGLISPVKWDRKARGGGDWEEMSSPKGDAAPPKPYHLKGDPLLWRRHRRCFTNSTLLIMVPKPQKTLSWFFIVRSWSGSWRQKPPKREGPSWTVASRKFSLSP